MCIAFVSTRAVHGAVPYHDFPWTIIEKPNPRYKDQCKRDMNILSAKMGRDGYDGPKAHCAKRWGYIRHFYIMEPSPDTVYLAENLGIPHYQILDEEKEEYLAQVKKRCKSKSASYTRVAAGENFINQDLLVINNFSNHDMHAIRDHIDSMRDPELVRDVLAKGHFDSTRGSFKVDTGSAGGQNHGRDPADSGIAKPRLGEKTMEEPYRRATLGLSQLMALLIQKFPLDKNIHKVGGIHKRWAALIVEGNLFQAMRQAIMTKYQAVGPHEDYMNDSRRLMSYVLVLARIIKTDMGWVRHAMIGYSRKSVHDTEIRAELISPAVQEIIKWMQDVPKDRKNVSLGLLKLEPSHHLKDVIVLPCHLKRCVSVSPYVDGIIRLQRLFEFSRRQCVALAYHSVTSETTWYFWHATQELLQLEKKERRKISSMNPDALAVEFYRRMKLLMPKAGEPPRRYPKKHQPHMGRGATIEQVRTSVCHLQRIVDGYTMLEANEKKHRFYHSKSIGIMINDIGSGGVHGAGPLTSQTLLSTLALTGLIPLVAYKWAEMAPTETGEYVEAKWGIGYGGGRSDQLLAALASAGQERFGDDFSFNDAENAICKFARDNPVGDTATGERESPFRDAIYPGQCLYEPSGDNLISYGPGGIRTIPPPGPSFPDPDPACFADTNTVWDTRTRGKRVNGKRKKASPNKRQKTCICTKDVLEILPSAYDLAFSDNKHRLQFCMTGLLAQVLGERKQVPWKRILAERKRNKEGEVEKYVISVLSKDMSSVVATLPTTGMHDCPIEYKNDAILTLAETKDIDYLSKKIFEKIESKKGKQQVISRQQGRSNSEEGDPYCIRVPRKGGKGMENNSTIGKEFFILCDNKGQLEHRARRIAVVVYTGPDRSSAIFARLDSEYGTSSTRWKTICRKGDVTSS